MILRYCFSELKQAHINDTNTIGMVQALVRFQCLLLKILAKAGNYTQTKTSIKPLKTTIMKKVKTNNDMVKALVKDLDLNHPFYMALLRERINMIMDMTMRDIENNPSKWENQIVDPSMYVNLNKIVKKHIGFDEQNIHETN